MNWKCWFFHDWGKWELTKDQGAQYRYCKRCNLCEMTNLLGW